LLSIGRVFCPIRPLLPILKVTLQIRVLARFNFQTFRLVELLHGLWNFGDGTYFDPKKSFTSRYTANQWLFYRKPYCYQQLRMQIQKQLTSMIVVNKPAAPNAARPIVLRHQQQFFNTLYLQPMP
jgi:hypothetical protein